MMFSLDQFVALLLREPRRERAKWIRAHGQAVYRRLPRRPAPVRWTSAVVVGGKIVSIR